MELQKLIEGFLDRHSEETKNLLPNDGIYGEKLSSFKDY